MYPAVIHYQGLLEDRLCFFSQQSTSDAEIRERPKVVPIGEGMRDIHEEFETDDWRWLRR
jgi:hypothetical protein